MKQTIYLAFYTFSFLLIYACAKDDDFSIEPLYNFETSAIVEPTNESILIDDTLWISAMIDGEIKELESNEMVSFNEANILSNYIVKSWELGDYSFNDGAYNFKFVSSAQYTTELGDATMIGLNYDNEDGIYQLKFGIVFNQPGIYSIDTDLIAYQYPSDNEPSYYGGGNIELYTNDGGFKYGSLFTDFEVANNNISLYNQLTETQKAKFEKIADRNQEKYFFIRAVK